MTMLAQASEAGWFFDLVGWPVWFVLPLAILAFWGIRRLASREVAQLPEKTRRGLMALRGATALLIVIFLVEPTCSRRKTDVDLPKVMVFLDTSGSMATRDSAMSARYRLDEATALGLVAPKLRDTTMVSAEKTVEKLLADIPGVANALADLGRSGTDESLEKRRKQAAESAVAHAKAVSALSPRVAGLGDVSRRFGEIALVMEQAAARIRRGARDAASGVDPLPPPERLVQSLEAIQRERRELTRRLREAQEAADAALVAGAEEGSDLAEGLTELAGLTRYERARRLVTETLAPALEGRAAIECVALRHDLAPLDVSKPDDALPMGPTDFEDPLRELARNTADDYLGGVLVVSDGRQTAGSDPVPAVRALRARGAGVAAVMVGNPEEPRDAVVGEIIGSSEVFCGETIRLDVRFRIVGFPNQPWELVLSCEGRELERRRTEGTGQWQQERFEFPAETPGLMQVQARLQRAEGGASVPEGLIAWYGLDDGQGQAARDSSGRGRAASLRGGSWRRSGGRFGGALELNGNGDYLVTPDLRGSVRDDSVTVALWIKPEEGGVIAAELGGDSPNSSDWHASHMEIMGDGEVRVRVWQLGLVSLGKAALGSWNHVALRYDAQARRLDGFLNGVKAGSASQGDRDAPWDHGKAWHYAFGCGDGTNMGDGSFLRAALDEVRIYGRALSDDEMTLLASGPSSGAAAAAPGEDAGLPHGVLREYWTGLNGNTVADLIGDQRFRDRPNGSEIVDKFESPADWADSYGSRLRGWIVPPQTGSYTFWICSDDAGQLWLGTDESPEKKTLIASVDSWASPGEWSKMPTQKSRPVSLREGRAYYVEVLHKEGTGGDHVAVGWQMPDSSIERPVSGSRLIPWKESLAKKLAEGKGALAAAAADAEASLDNNQSQVVISVNEDPLKVLLVDNHPRWESRYLMTLFERDRRIELVRRFRAVRLPRGERELLPPDQQKLDRYDLLVLGDVKADELSPEDQDRIASFVARRGGFLIVLAGPRGVPADYSLGGIADVLPVKNAPKAIGPGGDGAGAAAARRTALTLARAGHDSPITAVLEDPKLNLKLWPALPPVEWVARGVGAKLGAQVLLETADDLRTPVVAAARFGAGRVLYVGTDESWRWRDRLGDRVHQTFWLQALRWGLGARLRGGDPRLQVSLDRTLMTPEDTAELRSRARLADGTPVMDPLSLRIERLDDKGDVVPGTGRTLEMALVADSAEIWRQGIEGLEEGRWRLTVTSSHPDLAGLEETRELTVRKDQGLEGVDLAADLAALGRLAEAGGLRAAGFPEAAGIARELARELEPRRRPAIVTRSLWDNYLALAVVLGLLLGEWFWRKRHGLP